MNKLFFLLNIVCITFSCSTKHESYDKHKNLDNANWISDHKELPTSDSLFYLDNHAPLFRKEFKVTGKIEKATLLITAAGYCNASINGKKVGEDFLSPAWTDFSKRIYYSEYDISSEIEKGINCFGVTLGNGFYNLLPLKMWGRRNMRDVLPVGNPAFIAKLLITYANGKIEEVITDDNWKYKYGPMVKNNVYLGEVYDARQESKDWDLPDFNDDLWESALKVDGPEGELHKEFFPPVQVTKKITPLDIFSPK